MMKRGLISILLLAFCLGLGACGMRPNAAAWTLEDFSVYDEKGTEIDFPTNDNDIYLSKVNKKHDGDFQTKRGAKIGMRATTALEPYGDNFYWAVQRGRSPTLSEESEEKEWHEKYKTIQDVIKASPEFLKKGNVLYLSTQFFVDDKGNVMQYQLDEKGNPIETKDSEDKDRYKMSFNIQNEKIKEINFSVYTRS